MNAWTDKENAAVVALYFAMLDHATQGTPYNKRAMIRSAQAGQAYGHALENRGPLKARSKGSIEAKLMNCTAAHAALRPDAVTMDGYGYRALSNMQGALKAAMRREVERRETHTGPDSADLPARMFS